MAINFGRNPTIGRAATPRFTEAAVAEGREAHAAKAQANALRSQNIMGGAMLYNAGMGDKTPIADGIFGETAVPEAGNVYDGMTGAPETVDIYGGGGEVAAPAGETSGVITAAPPTGAVPITEANGVTAIPLDAAGGEMVASEALAGDVLATEALAGDAGATALTGTAGASTMAATMPYLAAALAANELFFS